MRTISSSFLIHFGQNYHEAHNKITAGFTSGIQTLISGLSENVPGVGKEGDVGALDFLVLSPSHHNGAVVHAEHQDLVDSRGLKGLLAFKIPGNLDAGSRGGERAGQTDNDGLLALKALRHVYLLGRESKVDGNIRESARNGDRHDCRSCCVRLVQARLLRP